MRPRIPGVDDGSDSSGVDGPGSGVDHGSDSDSDELPAFVRRRPDPPVVDGDVSARNQRLHAFGPWSISEIWDKERNVQIGWGANCNSHFCTSSALACKKPFLQGAIWYWVDARGMHAAGQAVASGGRRDRNQ